MPIFGMPPVQVTQGTPLEESPLEAVWEITRDYWSPGRRLRCFAQLVSHQNGCLVIKHTGSAPFIEVPAGMTYGTAMDVCEGVPWTRFALAHIPLASEFKHLTAIPERAAGRDPDLHPALQNLGDEINEDIRDACEAFDNPDVFYPGVEIGIEPVPDEHVALVIWALQRELDRELRGGGSDMWGGLQDKLPAPPLAELPANVQRALVERRRLRYAQFGIGRVQWQRGEWSLWEVPLDSEWMPRRCERLERKGAAS